MSPALVKLASLTLLFVQSVFACSPGPVLCIPLADCGNHYSPSHAHSDDACHSHAESHCAHHAFHDHDLQDNAVQACSNTCEPAAPASLTHPPIGCDSLHAAEQNDQQSSPSAACSLQSDCDCHMHVPVPRDAKVLTQQRSIDKDLTPIAVCLVFAAMLSESAPSVLDVAPPPLNVAHRASAQILALKATRLLI